MLAHRAEGSSTSHSTASAYLQAAAIPEAGKCQLPFDWMLPVLVACVEPLPPSGTLAPKGASVRGPASRLFARHVLTAFVQRYKVRKADLLEEEWPA